MIIKRSQAIIKFAFNIGTFCHNGALMFIICIFIVYTSNTYLLVGKIYRRSLIEFNKRTDCRLQNISQLVGPIYYKSISIKVKIKM